LPARPPDAGIDRRSASAATPAVTTTAAAATGAAAIATATAAATAARAAEAATTAAATATGAAEAATAAAARTTAAFNSLVALDRAAVQGRAVHGLHGRLALFIVRVRHEPEATAATGLAVLNNDRFGNSSKLFERRAEGIRIGVPRQPTNEQLH